MKKKTVISVMVVVMLFAVSLFFVGGTYARYVDSFDGTADVKVAAWKVALTGDAPAAEGNFKVTLKAEDNKDVVTDKIAPGVSASGKVSVDLNGTEVSVDLIAEIDNEDIKSALAEQIGEGLENSDISVTVTAAGKEESTNITKPLTGNGTQSTPFVISLPEGHTSGFGENDVVEVTIKVTWDNNNDENSETHTKIGKKAGEQALTLNIPVKMHVVQHIESSNYTPGA